VILKLCFGSEHGYMLYRDNNHLTNEGASMLSKNILSEISHIFEKP